MKNPTVSSTVPAPVLLALSKIDIDKAIRQTIAPMEYHGRAKVEIEYDLKVGADFDQAVTQSIPWQRIACLALSKLNTASIDTIIREAAETDTKTAIEEDISARARKVVDSLYAGATKTVSGKTTGNVKVLGVEIVA